MRLLTMSMQGMIVTAMAATSLRSQTVATVDSGMTRTQVVAALGSPLSTHTYGDFTYLFYKNGCERKCGMNDLVVFDSGTVVDAIFRSPARKYSGTSSSPNMTVVPTVKHAPTAPLKIAPAAAKKTVPTAAPTAAPTKLPAKVSTKQPPNEPLTSPPPPSLH